MISYNFNNTLNDKVSGQVNIAVCDDLKEALLDTKNVLEQIPYVKKIDLYSDIEFLFDEIQEGTHYDAVLMDIDWKKDRTIWSGTIHRTL